MKVAIYGRVSTKNNGQDTENQMRLLRAWCEKHEHLVIKEYCDHESGGTGDRHQFQEMLADAAKHKFELLLFWSLDRFSREGVLPTLQYLQRLTNFGIHYKSLTEEYLDSCGIFREAIISLMATLAKQERLRIRERVQAGMDRVRQTGTRSGKPIGRPRAGFDIEEARQMRAAGLSWRKISVRMDVPLSTLRKYVGSESSAVTLVSRV